MKLNQASRKLLVKELGKVSELIPNETRDFKVQIIDLDTLSLQPEITSHLDYDQIWLTITPILFVSNDGEVLGQVGKFPKTEMKLRFSTKFPFLRIVEKPTVKSDEFEFRHETVERALLRFATVVAKIRYILHIAHGCATLHKMPRQTPNLPTWLEQKSEETRQQLRSSLEKN